KPCKPGTLNVFSAPVFASTLPRLMSWLETLYENHMLPFRSACASGMPLAPVRLEGGPTDQSLPSLVMYSVPDFSSGAIGTSYSVNTARAASPVGRGRNLKFIAVGWGPLTRAR